MSLYDTYQKSQSIVPTPTTSTPTPTANGSLYTRYQKEVPKQSLSQQYDATQVSQTSQPQTFSQKIGSGINKFISNVKEGGIGSAIAGLIPGGQPKEVVEQNFKTWLNYSTLESPQAKMTEAAMKFGEEKAMDFAATNIAVHGLINAGGITVDEYRILKDKGFLDEKGYIKKGKTAVETARRLAEVAMFFPQLFVPIESLSTLATGGKAVNILGKAVPIGEIVAGANIGGSYWTLYTPGLEDVFGDKEIAGDAAKNYLKGFVVGGLVSIPLAWLKSPDIPAFKKLTLVEQQEMHALKLSLSRKFHPNSMTSTASDEAWIKISSKMKEGDLAWLRNLNTATPDKATQLLGFKLPTEVGGEIKQIGTPSANKVETKISGGTPATTTTKSITTIGVNEINPKELSIFATNSLLNVPGDAKPGIVQKYSLDEAKTGLTTGGKNLENRIVVTINDSGKPVLEDGRHLLEAYRVQNIPIPSNKVEFTSPQAKTAFTKITQAEIDRVSKAPKTPKVRLGQPKMVEPKPIEKPIIKPKVVSVPRTQLPVGEGEQKVSQLEARVKGVLKSATQEQIDELGLTTFNSMTNPDQMKKASEYVLNSQNDAMKVVQGDLEPPKGLLKNSIYVALMNDTTLPLDKQTTLAALTSKRFGQEIEILKMLNKSSPTRFMGEVYKVRADAVQKKFGKPVEQVAKDEVIKIKKEIKTPTKYDWQEFINSIEC